LNVEKALEHKIYENEEIKNMFTALGVSIEEKEGERVLNIDKLRYHKIVIMCDADVDGSHIVTLILTFFFRYMKPLIEGGYIYIAAPPLYLVKKGKKSVYCWNDEERLDAILRQVTIEEYLDADNVFSMLMGDEVPPRRKFIEENAHYANVDI